MILAYAVGTHFTVKTFTAGLLDTFVVLKASEVSSTKKTFPLIVPI